MKIKDGVGEEYSVNNDCCKLGVFFNRSFNVRKDNSRK